MQNDSSFLSNTNANRTHEETEKGSNRLRFLLYLKSCFSQLLFEFSFVLCCTWDGFASHVTLVNNCLMDGIQL